MLIFLGRVIFNLKLIMDKASDLDIKYYLKKCTLNSVIHETSPLYMVDFIIRTNHSSFLSNIMNLQLSWSHGAQSIAANLRVWAWPNDSLCQWNVNRNITFMCAFYLCLFSFNHSFNKYHECI